MAYTKRLDGRKFDETRPIVAKAGVIRNADGSGYFKIGKTEAYAAVYGPRDLYPKFMQDPTRGTLRVSYSMMPFSGQGDRVKPGPSRRSKELMLVIEKALLPVLNLDDYPNTVVDVFIEFPQTDAGTRCAGICAAAIALADAGFQMKDLVAAVATGYVDGRLIVDPNYEEEHYPHYATEPVEHEEVADIPIAMVPSTGEITLLQMDGKIPPEKLLEAVRSIRPVMERIAQAQRQAIIDKYERWARGEE